MRSCAQSRHAQATPRSAERQSRAPKSRSPEVQYSTGRAGERLSCLGPAFAQTQDAGTRGALAARADLLPQSHRGSVARHPPGSAPCTSRVDAPRSNSAGVDQEWFTHPIPSHQDLFVAGVEPLRPRRRRPQPDDALFAYRLINPTRDGRSRYGARRNGTPFINAQPRFGIYRDWRAETQTGLFQQDQVLERRPVGTSRRAAQQATTYSTLPQPGSMEWFEAQEEGLNHRWYRLASAERS